MSPVACLLVVDSLCKLESPALLAVLPADPILQLNELCLNRFSLRISMLQYKASFQSDA